MTSKSQSWAEGRRVQVMEEKKERGRMEKKSLTGLAAKQTKHTDFC